MTDDHFAVTFPDRSLDSVDNAIDPYLDTESLTSTDVRADPILSSLAKQQVRTASATPTGSPKVFKARPAPSTREGVGPRMTKSAALRQGLRWEESPSKLARPGTVSGHSGFGNTPGHKRVNLSLSIPSLASPLIAPRSTKSSQLRTGTGEIGGNSTTKRDPAMIAAANKARADEEKLRRRASVALPSSLSAPQIAPRMNRSAELRAGGGAAGSTPPPSFSRTHSALRTTTSINLALEATRVAADKDEKARRRASVIGSVKSLGAPSIQPRMNKSALLRAPLSSSSTLPSTKSLSSIASPATKPKMKSLPSVSSLSMKSVDTDAKVMPPPGPRPTKSSLLRANLGAKVISQ